jgi:hypothetical protein
MFPYTGDIWNPDTVGHFKDQGINTKSKTFNGHVSLNQTRKGGKNETNSQAHTGNSDHHHDLLPAVHAGPGW